MGRRLKVEEGFYAEDFLKAASEERDKRVYVRCMALHHVQEGKSAVRVGEQLCVHWRSVQEWVKRYKEKGLTGLGNRPGRGKKPMLSAAVGQDFKRRLLAHQRARAGGRFTGKEARGLLKKWFSIDCSHTSIYRWLHRIGLSWVTGRDRHPATHEVAQVAFKKTSWLPCNKSSRVRFP